MGKIKCLGINGIQSDVCSWYLPAKEEHKGGQIDLLIDRRDQVINLCEMKYSSAQYTITAEEDLRIRNRKAVFMRETETTKAVMVTMITTYGLTPGGYSNDIPCQLTMSDLFK